jgi:hypothetical protein
MHSIKHPYLERFVRSQTYVKFMSNLCQIYVKLMSTCLSGIPIRIMRLQHVPIQRSYRLSETTGAICTYEAKSRVLELAAALTSDHSAWGLKVG